MEKLMKRIERDTDAKVKEINEDAKRVEKEIFGEAKKKASEKKTSVLQKAEKSALREKQRMIADAVMKARKEKAMRIDKLLEEIISDAKKDLGKIREKPDYKKAIKKIAEKSVKEMPSEKVKIIVSEKDKGLLNAKDFSAKSSIKAKGNGLGVAVESENGKIRISHDFEEIINEKKQVIKKALMQRV